MLSMEMIAKMYKLKNEIINEVTNINCENNIFDGHLAGVIIEQS